MKTSTQQLRRYKRDRAFSQSLNRLIIQAFDSIFHQDDDILIWVKIVNYEPYANYHELVADITNNRQLLVSSLHCEDTIFGSPSTNIIFRAVHDYFHYIHGLDFSYENELIVNYYQNIYFRNLGASQFDLDLLNIETAGQIVHHKATGNFPDNQRDFAITELQKLGY